MMMTNFYPVIKSDGGATTEPTQTRLGVAFFSRIPVGFASDFLNFQLVRFQQARVINYRQASYLFLFKDATARHGWELNH